MREFGEIITANSINLTLQYQKNRNMCTQDIYKDHEEEEKMSKSMLYIYTHNGYNDAFLKKM